MSKRNIMVVGLSSNERDSSVNSFVTFVVCHIEVNGFAVT